MPFACVAFLIVVISLTDADDTCCIHVWMQFLAFGKYVCEQLRSKGFWADYIDPCSGLPMISLNCNKVYSEVDGMECLLNYKAYNAGFCKILTHPKWGSAVYPATIFAHAPADVVKSLIESLSSGSAA